MLQRLGVVHTVVGQWRLVQGPSLAGRPSRPSGRPEFRRLGPPSSGHMRVAGALHPAHQMLPWSVVVGSLQMGPRPVTLPARHLIRSNSRRCVDAPHLLTPGSAWPVEWSKRHTGRTPGGRHGSNLDKTTLVVATSTELPVLHCHLASAHDCVPFSLFVSVPLLASTFQTVDMSFFKNITDKFDNLGIGDSKRDEAQG